MLDVLVVGAGPAGAATALAVQRLGRSVAVWDPADVPARRVGESLPSAALPLLSDLGLPRLLEDGGHEPHPGQRVVWEDPTPRMVDGVRDPQGLGWHLNRPHFEHQLRDAMETAGAPLLRRTFRSAERHGEGWQVRDASGDAIETRVVVDATGRQARVARHLGARRLRDQGLVALVQWRRDEGADRCTLVEATEHGWWYGAPTPVGERVVVLHTRPELAGELRNGFEAALARTREVYRHVGEPLTAALGCDASGARLDRVGGPGWLAVGDASICFEPLSSQGLFHALYTGIRGAQAIHAALAGDPRPGLAYGRVLADVRQRYLERQAYVLGAVRRWPMSPFWNPQPTTFLRSAPTR